MLWCIITDSILATCVVFDLIFVEEQEDILQQHLLFWWA